MATIAGAEGRKDLHQFDPNRLVIVTDPNNVLCQEVRNRTPTPEWLVISIMQPNLGVTTPIQVRRGPKVDGEFTYEVVVGRQRVKAAREANKRLIKARKPPVFVKAEVVQGTDEDMLELMRTENVRVDMTPLERAETAKISIARGVSEIKVINDSFRGSKAEYERHMALLACHPGVVAAVEDGRLSIKAVDTFTELSRDDQGALLERMVAEGKTGPKEARTIAATADETLQHNGTGRPGDEPKIRTKSTAPKARNAQEFADRLASLEASGGFESVLERWTEVTGADLENCDMTPGGLLALVLPAQYFSAAEELVTLLISDARRQELKWALRDDDALATASEDDLGGWVSADEVKAAKADKLEAKKLADKAAKAEARKTEKEKTKADKVAQREANRQAARDAVEAKKTKKAEAKTKAAEKRAAKDLEAAMSRVPNRGGKRRRSKK